MQTLQKQARPQSCEYPIGEGFEALGTSQRRCELQRTPDMRRFARFISAHFKAYNTYHRGTPA
ncbi:hypothetical protein TYRP_014930 [Tyrophagus putrescentiae]|nr:hypothetical protein TYRP_014930 [Tyrophagus putrescentiae]